VSEKLPLRTELTDGERCIDRGNPCGAVHAGKLQLPYRRLETPRNHCVIRYPNSSNDDEYYLLRLTPHNQDFCMLKTDDCCPAVHTSEQVADLHARHLKFLGKAGLRPWIHQMQTEICPDFDENQSAGIFIEQKLLPEGSETVANTRENWELIHKRLREYYTLATDEPMQLYDLASPKQYSRLPDDEVVLHDVEPLYRQHLPS
jgi:hypothetical protein